ncbi:MFS transporter [Bacteroidota bacterium]
MIKSLRLLFSHKQARVAGLVFSINSILFSSWITRLPEIQDELEISEGELGLALLGLPLGSLLIIPPIGWFIHRVGAGKATLITGIFFCILSPLPVLAPTYFLLILSIVFVGMTMGSMDVAMNAVAAAVEKRYSLNIMSSCHGMWSFGGMLGAGSTGIMMGFNVPAYIQIPILAVILLIFFLSQSSTLLSVKEDDTVSDVVLSIPTGPLVGLAVIGFCSMLGEGAIADWTAVYLKNTLESSAFLAGLGYAGFSFSMAIGRFYGDRIIARWGARRLVLIGGLIGLGGILFGLAVPYPYAVITGFTFAGFGFSGIVPAIYGSASRMPGRAPGASIAAVASFGYLGMFFGPPVIGFVAEEFGLRIALGIVVVLMGFVVLLAGKARFD